MVPENVYTCGRKAETKKIVSGFQIIQIHVIGVDWTWIRDLFSNKPDAD